MHIGFRLSVVHTIIFTAHSFGRHRTHNSASFAVNDISIKREKLRALWIYNRFRTRWSLEIVIAKIPMRVNLLNV